MGAVSANSRSASIAVSTPLVKPKLDDRRRWALGRLGERPGAAGQRRLVLQRSGALLELRVDGGHLAGAAPGDRKLLREVAGEGEGLVEVAWLTWTRGSSATFSGARCSFPSAFSTTV